MWLQHAEAKPELTWVALETFSDVFNYLLKYNVGTSQVCKFGSSTSQSDKDLLIVSMFCRLFRAVQIYRLEIRLILAKPKFKEA